MNNLYSFYVSSPHEASDLLENNTVEKKDVIKLAEKIKTLAVEQWIEQNEATENHETIKQKVWQINIKRDTTGVYNFEIAFFPEQPDQLETDFEALPAFKTKSKVHKFAQEIDPTTENRETNHRPEQKKIPYFITLICNLPYKERENSYKEFEFEENQKRSAKKYKL